MPDLDPVAAAFAEFRTAAQATLQPPGTHAARQRVARRKRARMASIGAAVVLIAGTAAVLARPAGGSSTVPAEPPPTQSRTSEELDRLGEQALNLLGYRTPGDRGHPQLAAIGPGVVFGPLTEAAAAFTYDLGSAQELLPAGEYDLRAVCVGQGLVTVSWDAPNGGHGTLSVSCNQREQLTPVSMVIPGILRLRLSPDQVATGNSGFAAELARSFEAQARALIDWRAPGTVSGGSAELTSGLHNEDSTGFAAGRYRLSIACVGTGRITATLGLDAKQESTAVDCTTSGATGSVTVTAEQPGHTMSVTIAPDDPPIRAGAAFTITRR